MNSAPIVISGETMLEAWQAATHLLVEEGPRFNLAVHIKSPNALAESELRPWDPSRVRNVTPLLDVANTIFPPERLWMPNNRTSFYSHYGRVYYRGHRRKTTAWGTYFQRLIAFGEPSINQIERVVDALEGWGRKPHAALVVHLSASTLDKPKPLGAPCWQYGQFNVNNEQVSLTAVYRSQDYFQKALGNFAGLARLLKFVCSESGTTPGSLTCLSTFAQLGPHRSAARTLLANL